MPVVRRIVAPCGMRRLLCQIPIRRTRRAAALVVDGDEAIAWCEYGTPEELPTIHHRKQYEAELDVLPDYRLTCISSTAGIGDADWLRSRCGVPRADRARGRWSRCGLPARDR